MRRIIILLTFFSIFLTILVNYYFEYIGLGDPIRYDSDLMYGYAPKENQKKKRLNNAFVTINESGLRSLDNWKDSKKKKILFIGDSITYGGSYIDDKETFSHLVCQKLLAYTCGNAGVNAYGIINMIHRLKYDERIKNFNVVIFLFAGVDFYREYANSHTAHFYLNSKKFFLPGLMEAISFFATRYDLNMYLSKKDDTKKYNHEKELIDYSITALNDEVQRLHKNNKIVKIIYSIDKTDKKSESKKNKYILNNLKKLKLNNFYSLENILDKDEYFYDDIHLSVGGHKIVAKKIISILSTLNFNKL